jgi:hypothetical protein
MSHKSIATVATMGIDIGKNSFHVVGFDRRGVIVLRQKWSRAQVEVRLANMSACLIGMEACVGAHHLSRRLRATGGGSQAIQERLPRNRTSWQSYCNEILAESGQMATFALAASVAGPP